METPASGRDKLVALAIFAACLLLYCSNLRTMGAWDSLPARYLPFSLLRQGNLDLDEFRWLYEPVPPYFLRQTAEGHWISAYPVATAVLVTPLYVPAWLWSRWQQVDDDDVRFRLAAAVSERLAAAAIAADGAVMLFLALCAVTSRGKAAAIAAVYALGTNTWAVSSQALWQHGAAELCLAGLSYCLLRPLRSRAAVVAGGLAAVGVMARPPMVIFAILAAVFVWRNRRQHMLRFLLLPLAGLSALAVYNLTALGRVSGGYRGTNVAWPNPVRTLGLLFSPNRGLLVYTPAAALVAPALWGRRTGWLAYLAVGIIAYFVLFTCFRSWWGGFTYGPRYLTDVLPALALCSVPAVEHLWRSALGRSLLTALAVWGIVVQVIGVYYDDGSWNRLPKSVDDAPERVWDAGDSQIVRAVRSGFHGGELGSLLSQALVDRRTVSLRAMAPAHFAGDIEVVDVRELQNAKAGTTVSIDVRATNAGATVWPAFSDYGFQQVALSYCWWRTRDQPSKVGAYQEREIELAASRFDVVPLPRNLGPGESARIRGRVRVPARPGEYALELFITQPVRKEAFHLGAKVMLPAQVR